MTTYCITKTLSQSSLFVCEKDLNFGNQYLKRISAKEIFSCKVSRENNFDEKLETLGEMSAIILCPGIPPPTPKTFHQLENIYLFFNLFSNLKLFTQTELSLPLSLSLSALGKYLFFLEGKKLQFVCEKREFLIRHFPD